MKIMERKWTGERLESFIQTRDTIDHLHRYALVLDYIKDKVVLDIACGEGYGSNLMSQQAQYVYGVDIDVETILNAQKKYKKENLNFQNGRADLIPIETNSIDVVVSFETIEHHDKHEEMMLEIKRVLKPDGIIVISTPDKYFYTDKRGFKNEFHVKELYREDFVNLVNNHFKVSQLLIQSYINGNSYIYNNSFERKINVYSGDFSIIKEEEELDPMYLVVFASDKEFKKQSSSFFNGSRIQRHQQEEIINNRIRSCNTFKVGNFILYPLKLFKKYLK